MLKRFLAMVERQFDQQVKILRSDNGTEFICLKSYFLDQGIIFQTSCTGTPQQNGRVERKHQHIMNVARALRFQGSLPIKFWGECVLTAGYLINRTPSLILNGQTPYQVLYGVAPTYHHLRVLGSLCYAHETTRDKMASRSRRCVFVGYPYGKKGWRLYDLDKQVFFVSRDVVFSEGIFPFANDTDRSSNNEVIHTVSEEPQSLISGSMLDLAHSISEPNTDIVQTDSAHPEEEEEEILGRGHRQRYPSIRLQNYVTNTIQKLSPSLSSSIPQHSSGTPYPLAHYVNCDKFSVRHRNFLAALTAEREPTSYSEAVKNKGWREAMQQEISALEHNKTWVVQNLPDGKKALGCKWVYKIKHNSDGTIERLKARLVILGNHQTEGLDYTETFAPVAKMVTVRVFLVVVAAKNWAVHQMDVHNAFLHGDLQEEVYMKFPPGFHAGTTGKVCKLQKSLYGLKQAPRCWFAKLSSALTNYGFQQSYSDYSLFTFHREAIELNVLVYVDDLIIAGNHSTDIQAFKD